MNKAKRTIAAALVAASVTSGISLMGASPAFADVCGWSPSYTDHIGGQDDGYYEKGVYNHCDPKGGVIKIRIDYAYASEEKCVTAGKTTLYADPNKGALIKAVAIGPC